MTQLLKKESFKWGEEAFNTLKQAMVSPPALALPNFNDTFTIEADASDVGIGAVSMQREHPISFISKALSPRHLSLSTYEKELLAIIHAVQKWTQYLLDRHFVIKTDQQSLKH